MRRWILSMIGVVVLTASPSQSATDESPPPAPGGPGATSISTSHRFLVSGMSSAENAAFAVAVEDVADKVESLVGRPLPFQRGQTLQLSVRFREDQPRSQVVKAQGWVDRQLAQKLIIINPVTVDQEDVLEGLCWLLLNRYVVARQSFEERTNRLGPVPDWLSVGMAQSLFIALRARNRHVVVKRWEGEEAMGLTELLALEYLPDGRWAEKAFCGAAVDWMADVRHAGGVLGAVLERRAHGGRISDDWLAQQITGRPEVREMEKAWSLWIAKQTNVKKELGAVSEEDVAALRKLMAVRVEEFGISSATNAPGEMDFSGMLEFRREPWMRPLAGVLSLKIKTLGIASSPEFRGVLASYGRYLDGLSAHARAGWLSRLVRRVPSRRGLERRLAEADGALERYREELNNRVQYVNDVERGARSAWVPADTNAIARMDRWIPRTEMQRYVDEIEKQAP